MQSAGDAVMGSAAAAGERRALKAASDAVTSPLMEGVKMRGAKGVLVNITGDVTMRDIADAMNYIEEQVGSDAKIINGYVDEPQVSGEIRVTVIVTGFKRVEPGEERQPVSSSGQQEKTPPKAPHVQGFGRLVQSSGYPEQVVEDMRIPAYIRKSRSIQEPFDIGRACSTVGSRPSGGSDPMPGQSDEDEQIQKGATDTPAYLRRKNNPPLQ